MNVIYGGAGGLSAAGNQSWSQDSPGVPDTAEPGDRYGSVLAASNFGGNSNHNGNAWIDLAVGVPDENLGAISNAGGVHAFYGSAGGLGPGNILWTQDSDGIADAAEPGDRFGAALATADFGRAAEGYTRADMAIGVPGEDAGTIADAGAVHVLYGRFFGLSADGSQYWTQDSPGITDAAEAGDRFGSALAAADMGEVGWADLAIGVPDEDARTVADVGVVHVIYSLGATPSAGHLNSINSQYWSQNTSGIADASEPGDRFGSVLTAWNFGGQPQADLAIGVPDEDKEGILDLPDAGVVHVIKSPLHATQGSQLFSQDTVGIVDASEAGDRFGSALTGANFGRAPQGDLAIGVPDEGIGAIGDAGVVHVIYGIGNDPAGGLSPSASQYWSQESDGITDAAETGDRFGAALGN